MLATHTHLDSGIFSTQSDVFAFGIILWELFSRGAHPFFSLTSDQQVQTAILNDQTTHHHPPPAQCPPHILTLMQQCWHMDPTSRPTFDRLAHDLQALSNTLSDTNMLYDSKFN